MVRRFQNYSDADIGSLASERLRLLLLGGREALLTEPAVVAAFEVLYEDVLPVRFGGDILFNLIDKAVVQARRERSPSLLHAPPPPPAPAFDAVSAVPACVLEAQAAVSLVCCRACGFFFHELALQSRTPHEAGARAHSRRAEARPPSAKRAQTGQDKELEQDRTETGTSKKGTGPRQRQKQGQGPRQGPDKERAGARQIKAARRSRRRSSERPQTHPPTPRLSEPQPRPKHPNPSSNPGQATQPQAHAPRRAPPGT